MGGKNGIVIPTLDHHRSSIFSIKDLPILGDTPTRGLTCKAVQTRVKSAAMKDKSIPKGKLLEDDLCLGGQAGISDQPNGKIMIDQWTYAKKWIYESPNFLQTCGSCRVLATSELRQSTVSLQGSFFLGHGLLQKRDMPQKRSAVCQPLGGCWTELQNSAQVSPRWRCHHQKRPYWRQLPMAAPKLVF